MKTLYGVSRLKVPRGIQPGELLRMRGEGFPVLGRRSKGDHVVQVIVQTPKKLSSKEERIFRELAALDGGGERNSGGRKKGFTGMFFSLKEALRRRLEPLFREAPEAGESAPGG